MSVLGQCRLFGCFLAPFGGFGLVADADEGVGYEGVCFGEKFWVALVLALAEARGEIFHLLLHAGQAQIRRPSRVEQPKTTPASLSHSPSFSVRAVEGGALSRLARR